MDRFSRWSLSALAVLGLAVLAYPFLPISEVGHHVYYDAVAVPAMLLAFSGLAHHRPSRRLVWLLLLGGFSGWVVGDIMTALEQSVFHITAYPVPSDAVYLSAYLALAGGALVMVRTRRAGRDVTALLDAAIIATGAGVLAAVFVIAPLAADSTLSSAGKVVSSAYPVGDVLLVAMMVRMWAAPGARTTSFRLLLSALALTLVGDVAWNVSVIVTDDVAAARWTDVSWLWSYLLVGAAACVPSMRTLTEPAPDRGARVSPRRRLVVLACGLMLPAIALLIDGANGGGVLWPVIGIGALLISALVLARMAGILAVVETQAVQLAALARSDALTGAPNRRSWDHELSRLCMAGRADGTPVAVAMMDMDFFKAYNDAHGHQAGDRLLREAVAAWTAKLGKGPVLARYGGEEFAVLLPDVTVVQAVAAIDGLRGVTPSGQTFSAGVSAWNPRSEPSTAVADADHALYQAKAMGRNRVVAYGGTPSPARSAGAPTRPPVLVGQARVEDVTGPVAGPASPPLG